MLTKKTLCLNSQEIDAFLLFLDRKTAALGLTRRKAAVCRLAVEEFLICYQQQSAQEAVVEIKDAGGVLDITLTVPGDRFDPTEEADPFLLQLLDRMEAPPQFSYQDGQNRMRLHITLYGTFGESLKLTWQYLRNYKPLLAATLLLQLLGLGADVLLPLIAARQVIHISDSALKQLMLVAPLVLATTVGALIVTYYLKKCYLQLSEVTLNSIESNMLRKTVSIQNSCIERNGSGTFIHRLTVDTSNLANSFINTLDTGSLLINSIGIILSILAINPVLFLYVLSSKLLLFFLESKRSVSQKRSDRASRSREDGFSGLVSEVIRGARDVKLLDCEDSFVSMMQERVFAANKSRRDTELRNKMTFVLRNTLAAVLDMGLILLIAWMMYRSKLAAAEALVIYNYNVALKPMAIRIGTFMDNIRNFTVSSERVFAINNDYEFPKEHFGQKTIPEGSFHGDIELRNVTFAYRHFDLLDRNRNILKNLSLTIHAGERVAFVGKSGCGKSTLFNLISRLYAADSGEIYLDGIPISQLDKASIRRNIVVVSQSPYLFNMSIRDNFRLVRPDISDEEIIQACKLACIHEDIQRMPLKYGTVIGESGVILSGGQRQRLAIARGLLMNGNIILLDEATSALDNATQRQVQQAIANLRNNRTVILIAHRLSTIVDCERIFYMESGQILASGTHAELLEQCPSYAELYQAG